MRRSSPTAVQQESTSRLAGVAGRLALVLPLALTLASLAGEPARAVEPTGTITEVPLPLPGSEPGSIVAGSDGNMWFTEFAANRIGRVTAAGAVTEFALPQPESGPAGIAMGPEGNLWFTEAGAGKRSGRGEAIGRITPGGEISEFATLSKESSPEDITLGPDGNLWFTEGRRNRIGRITPSGVVAEFPTEHPTGGIAQGPDGNLWFTEPGGNVVGMITPTGTIHEYAIPLERQEIERKEENTEPEDITAALDGNLWFTESRADRIGRISPAGAIAQFPINTESANPLGIAAGPDGNVWFTEFGFGGRRTVGRITPAGVVTEFQTPTPESGPFDLAPGAGGSLWLTERRAGQLGVIASGGPAALAQPPAITGGGLAGTLQICNGSWASWGGTLQPSFSLFPFDGYRWYLDGTLIAAGQSYTPAFTQLGHALTCGETITYASPFLVTTAATSAPVAVVEPPPVVSAARQSAAVWREGSRLARITRARRHLPPVGTTFSFSLNEPAAITLTFNELVPGRRVGKSCVARTRRNSRRRRCLRQVPVGRLAFSGHPATNTVAFAGRLSTRVKLRPGSYVLTILARNAEGAPSAPAALRFSIVASPPSRHARHG